MTLDLQAYNSLDLLIQPPYLYPPYRSTIKRAPLKPLLSRPQTLSELTGPVYAYDAIQALDNDLTRNAQKNGEALGERIIVVGRVLDEGGRAVPRRSSHVPRPVRRCRRAWS
jgi:protocatechuate 3,4-dioxygenase, beta subunit